MENWPSVMKFSNYLTLSTKLSFSFFHIIFRNREFISLNDFKIKFEEYLDINISDQDIMDYI